MGLGRREGLLRSETVDQRLLTSSPIISGNAARFGGFVIGPEPVPGEVLKG
jgi:hypothetical protein